MPSKSLSQVPCSSTISGAICRDSDNTLSFIARQRGSPARARDQEAGNDKEDVDADEAARHRLRESMEVHNQHHRDGPQPVDLRSASI